MEMIPVWAPVVSSTAALLGIVLICWTLRNSLRQTKFNMLNYIQGMVLQPEMQRAMRELHALNAEAVSAPQSAADLERVELVLRTYDILAHRLRCGVLPKKETLQTEAIPVLSLWPKLEGFVDRQAGIRGIPYKPHLKWLVGECKAYMKRYHPEVVIRTHDWEFERPGPCREGTPNQAL